MGVWLALLVKGLVLGLAAAAPIGPVNVEIARRTLRFGRGAGFLVGCGAVTVDVGYAVVTSFAMLPARQSPPVKAGLAVGAALFLGYLGVACLRSAVRGHGGDGEVRPVVGNPEDAAAKARRSAREDAKGGRESGVVRHYGTGLLMTALNPMTLAFWFSVSATAVSWAGGGAAGWGVPVVCAGVFGGAFAWVCFFTLLVGRLKRFGGQRWIVAFDAAGGVTLLAFAGLVIWRGIGGTL